MADLIARQAALAKDGGFQDRVKSALLAAAVAIQGEAVGSSGNIWGKRQTHALAVLTNPVAFIDRYAWAVATDATVAGQIGTPVSITSSTNATPTVLTVPTGHGIAVGDTAAVAGHLVNTAANGTWVVQATTTTTITLPTSGNGAGTATGSVTKQPTDLAVTNAVSAMFNDFAGVLVTD